MAEWGQAKPSLGDQPTPARRAAATCGTRIPRNENRIPQCRRVTRYWWTGKNTDAPGTLIIGQAQYVGWCDGLSGSTHRNCSLREMHLLNSLWLGSAWTKTAPAPSRVRITPCASEGLGASAVILREPSIGKGSAIRPTFPSPSKIQSFRSAAHRGKRLALPRERLTIEVQQMPRLGQRNHISSKGTSRPQSIAVKMIAVTDAEWRDARRGLRPRRNRTARGDRRRELRHSHGAVTRKKQAPEARTSERRSPSHGSTLRERRAATMRGGT